VSLPSPGPQLDDSQFLERADPLAMLREVAGAGAQVREAAGAAAEAGLARLADDGRPRAVVVVGVGVSALCGELLLALAGPRCPVPVTIHRGSALPRWVGAADVVCHVSATGAVDETLPVVEQAVSRGCSLVGAGPDGSPLAELIARGRGVFVPVLAGRLPRASLWSLAVPLLLAGQALDLLPAGSDDLAAAADRLDAVAEQCRPTSESFVNPAKQLALDLAGTLPVVWGTSPLTGVAAARLVAQLAANAKCPGLSGVLPESGRDQVALFDGIFGGPRTAAGDPATGRAERDIFADPADEPESVRLRLVLLHDPDADPLIRREADAASDLARARGLEVTELVADGAGPVERFASVVALPDFASVYLALLGGIDPTPTTSVADLQARLAP